MDWTEFKYAKEKEEEEPEELEEELEEEPEEVEEDETEEIEEEEITEPEPQPGPESIALKSCVVQLKNGSTLKLVKGEPVELSRQDRERLQRHNFIN